MALDRIIPENASPAKKRKHAAPSVQKQLNAIWKHLESAGLIADGAAAPGSAAQILSQIKSLETLYPDV